MISLLLVRSLTSCVPTSVTIDACLVFTEITLAKGDSDKLKKSGISESLARGLLDYQETRKKICND